MPKAAWKILRSQSYSEKEFRPYIMLIGQTALAWNDLHEELGSLFWRLCKTQNAISIWQSSNVDRAKRAMLEAVIKDLDKEWIEKFPQVVKDVEWLLAETRNREDDRNTVIHAPLQSRGLGNLFLQMAGRPPEVTPHNRYGNPRAAKLVGKEVLNELRWCRDSFLVLRNYADALDYALWSPKRPWPGRPQLPNRGMKKSRPRK